jgi:hypothetical protein
MQPETALRQQPHVPGLAGGQLERLPLDSLLQPESAGQTISGGRP